MALFAMTSKPDSLLRAIKFAIDGGSIDTWAYDGAVLRGSGQSRLNPLWVGVPNGSPNARS
jgi:hypothetical protein